MTSQPLTIVAGVGPGMGLSLARRFAAGGHRVAMIARNREALAGMCGQISGDAHGHAGDLTNVEDIRRVMAEIREAHGAASGLIYNAGVLNQQPAMAMDPAVFHRDLMLCVTGALVCAQAVHPDMLAAGRGTMLFTGGGLALFPQFGTPVPSLTAGKSALRGLVYALAGELRPAGINVGMVTIAGTVEPGTAFDPDRIAERFWTMATRPAGDEAPGAETVEVIHDGKA